MNDCYTSPLTSRYASKEMSHLFSPQFKHQTWRTLWIELAKQQKNLGLAITDAQIKELEKHSTSIDFEEAKKQESLLRHDVMAHIKTFGLQCPQAKGIIHLGATSCFVTDNTDLIQMQQALVLIRNKLIQVMRNLCSFSEKTLSIPCLSYTHFQPAQPTTVGRRACLWLQDLFFDLKEINHTLDSMHFLGVKGATGTQASFLSLFEGDQEKVKQLDENLASALGFTQVFPLSGQTYTRKQDVRIMGVLSSFASSTHKFATDLRLLAHLQEIEEPFQKTQVGSSAMPHKRNPIYSERICGLCRFLISMQENALYTEATQWLERSLDDSSNRRLYIPDSFLTADAILNLLCSITSELNINPVIISKNLEEELPFLATEAILMHLAKQGKDRQALHEILKTHALKVATEFKKTGKKPSLFQIIAQDKEIALSEKELNDLAKPEKLIGRSVEQAQEFLQLVHSEMSSYKDCDFIKPPNLI